MTTRAPAVLKIVLLLLYCAKKNLTNYSYLVQKVDPEIVFTKQERIGKGSFGEVFKGIDNRTQQVGVLLKNI